MKAKHDVAPYSQPLSLGHDTTSNALSFCLYHLAVNKVNNESSLHGAQLTEHWFMRIGHTTESPGRNHFPAEWRSYRHYPDCRTVQKDELSGHGHQRGKLLCHPKAIDRTRQSDQKNLRIFPPGNDLMARTVQEDMNLGGIMIPQGTLVSVDIHALHHRPDIWPDPERFDPERFRDNNSGERHEGIVWVPFSGGSRQCIGMNFSLFEQRVVLSMLRKSVFSFLCLHGAYRYPFCLVRKYEWDLPVDCPHRDGLKFDFPLNLAPRSLKVQFRPRYW